jgi:hypothetical protein
MECDKNNPENYQKHCDFNRNLSVHIVDEIHEFFNRVHCVPLFLLLSFFGKVNTEFYCQQPTGPVGQLLVELKEVAPPAAVVGFAAEMNHVESTWLRIRHLAMGMHAVWLAAGAAHRTLIFKPFDIISGRDIVLIIPPFFYMVRFSSLFIFGDGLVSLGQLF